MPIVNPRPDAILYGINDRSRLVQTINELIPAHFPLMYTLAGWGSYDGEVITEGTIPVYGSDVTDPNSPYGTHQSLLGGELLSVGNAIMTKRVKLENAKQALIRLSLEVATFLKPVYKRDENNQVVYQIINHERVPVIESYVNGTRLIWHSSSTAEGFYPENFKEFGTGIPLSNFRSGATIGNLPSYYPQQTLSHGSITLDPNGPVINLTSTMYPILDALLIYDGTRGNHIGLLFNDVTTNSSTNINLSASLGSYIYGLQVTEFDPVTGRSMIINSLLGDSSHNVVFGEAVYNPRDNSVMSIKDVLEENYDLFEKAHFYKANYDKVMRDIINGRTNSGVVVTGEQAFFTETTESLSLYGLVDILKGVGTDGNPYSSFTVSDAPSFNGILVNTDYPINGINGSDGLVYDASGAPNRLENLRLYDEAVRFELENFGDIEHALRDMAKYPITSIWDTGYSIETKKAIASILARRRDIYVALATFTVADYIDVVEVDDSRISCAGASNNVAFGGYVLDAIEIDGELFTFPNDWKLTALGDKLQQFGMRLYVVLDSGDVGSALLQGSNLRDEINKNWGNLVYYRDNEQTFGPEDRIIYYIENINPNKDTRIRLHPASAQWFPHYYLLDEDTMITNEVYLLSDNLAYQNRTLGYIYEDGGQNEEVPPYQVTFCLSKYVPRAISCAGATSEVAIILDPRQLYSLKINSIPRGVGLTVADMLSVFKSIKLDARTYLATEAMIDQSN
jgi:hypothetical protein